MAWIPPTLTKQQLEQRRIKALELLNDPTQKRTQLEVAAIIGVTPAAICIWKKREQQGEVKATAIPGRPTRLNSTQLEQLKNMILESPQVYGYQRLGWTTTLVADLIEQKFSVTYHSNHVGKILHRLNLSPQRPKVRGIKRDEAKIQKWIEEDYPALKKNGKSKDLR
jgi:putative transposase